MTMIKTRCVEPHVRIDSVINEIEQLVLTGLTYTAGCGIDITGSVITAAIDGTSITCTDGVLSAVAASDLTAGCGITIAAGEVSAAVDGTTIDCVGGNLTVIAYEFGKIAVSGQTDVDATTVVDTVTFVAGSNMTITTSGKNVTFAATDTNTTYTAGAGVNLSATKFVADPHDASHVGLVDPTTGDDSTADDAQIGILWHEIADFDNGRNQLYGHAADDLTKPKVTAKMTEDWLELLEDYSEVDRMVIGSDPDAAEVEGDEKVKWIPSPQKVIWGIDPDGGHTIEASGTTLTLTLKVTKYTFDAVNFVSAVDADVEIVYSDGTECA